MELDQLVSQMNEHQQRLFACDCAERVLPKYEEGNPADGVPRLAVAIARRYAHGKASINDVDVVLHALYSTKQVNEFDRFALLPHDDISSLAWKAALRAVLAAWFPDIRTRSTMMASERASGEGQNEQSWQRERVIWYLTGQHAAM
jgi:hypothetical protein